MNVCMYVCMYVCVTQREQIMNKSQRTFFEEGSHGDGRAGFSDKVGQRGVGGRVRRHGQMVERRPRLAGRPCGGGARGARPWRTRGGGGVACVWGGRRRARVAQARGRAEVVERMSHMAGGDGPLVARRIGGAGTTRWRSRTAERRSRTVVVEQSGGGGEEGERWQRMPRPPVTMVTAAG